MVFAGKLLDEEYEELAELSDHATIKAKRTPSYQGMFGIL